jgi:hypothetical protein
MGYLLPLILSELISGKPGELVAPLFSPEWTFVLEAYYGKDPKVIDLWTLAQQLQTATKFSEHELMRRINQHEEDDVSTMIFDTTINGRTRDNPLADPRRYKELLQTVARFKSPSLQGAADQTDITSVVA